MSTIVGHTCFLGTGCAILKDVCFVLQEWGLYRLGLGSGLGLL